MAAPCKEGALDPHPSKSSLAVAIDEEQLVCISVLPGIVEEPDLSLAEQDRLSFVNHNLAVQDLERRGCAVALPASFLVDLSSSRDGYGRSSSSQPISSDPVKNFVVLDGGVTTSSRSDDSKVSWTGSGVVSVKDRILDYSQVSVSCLGAAPHCSVGKGDERSSSSPSQISDPAKTSEIQAGGVSGSLGAVDLKVSLTRSGSTCHKDQFFKNNQFAVLCSDDQQLIDGTGLQLFDRRDLFQKDESYLQPSSIDRSAPSREASLAEILPVSLEVGRGGEAGLQRESLQLDVAAPEPVHREAITSIQLGPKLDGAGLCSKIAAPASRCYEEGRDSRSSFRNAGGRGASNRGGRLSSLAGGDRRRGKQSLGGSSDLHPREVISRFGSRPDPNRGGNGRGGVGNARIQTGGGLLGRAGGRDVRWRGKGGGQLRWVGSSSAGYTDDSGAVDPGRFRDRSPPRYALQDDLEPTRLVRPGSVDSRSRTRPDSVGIDGLIANLPPSSPPPNLQGREKSSGGKAGGAAGLPSGAPVPPKHSSWSAVVSGSKEIRRPDRNLQFFPPSLVDGRRSAVCSSSAQCPNVQRWQSSLVGRVMGRKPFFQHLKKSLERSWRLGADSDFELFSRTEGIFIVKFSSEENCIRILESGPWFFEGRLILFRRWEMGGASERALLHKAPLWIRLPLLPLELWTKEDLSRIVSVIGLPLHVDLATATKSRIGFARCCVEVGYDDDLPQEVPVTFGEAGVLSFLQDVIHEWKPPRCDLCRVLGHEEGDCPPPPLGPARRVPSSREKHQDMRNSFDDQSRGRGDISQATFIPAFGDYVNPAGAIVQPADLIEKEGSAPVESADLADLGAVDRHVGLLSSCGLADATPDSCGTMLNSPPSFRSVLVHSTLDPSLLLDDVETAVGQKTTAAKGVSPKNTLAPNAVTLKHPRAEVEESGSVDHLGTLAAGPSQAAVQAGAVMLARQHVQTDPPHLEQQFRHQALVAEDAGGEDGDLVYLSQSVNPNLLIKKEKLEEAQRLNPASAPPFQKVDCMTFDTLVDVVEFLSNQRARIIINKVHRLVSTVLESEDGVTPPPCVCEPCKLRFCPLPSSYRILRTDGDKSILEQGEEFGDLLLQDFEVDSSSEEDTDVDVVASAEREVEIEADAGILPLGDDVAIFVEEAGLVEDELTSLVRGEEEDLEEALNQQDLDDEGGGAVGERDPILDPLFDWSKVPKTPPCLENFPSIIVCPNPEYELQVRPKVDVVGRGKQGRKRDRGKERAASKEKQCQKLSGVASCLGQGRSTRSQGGTTIVVPLNALPP